MITTLRVSGSDIVDNDEIECEKIDLQQVNPDKTVNIAGDIFFAIKEYVPPFPKSFKTHSKHGTYMDKQTGEGEAHAVGNEETVVGIYTYGDDSGLLWQGEDTPAALVFITPSTASYDFILGSGTTYGQVHLVVQEYSKKDNSFLTKHYEVVSSNGEGKNVDLDGRCVEFTLEKGKIYRFASFGVAYTDGGDAFSTVEVKFKRMYLCVKLPEPTIELQTPSRGDVYFFGTKFPETSLPFAVLFMTKQVDCKALTTSTIAIEKVGFSVGDEETFDYKPINDIFESRLNLPGGFAKRSITASAYLYGQSDYCTKSDCSALIFNPGASGDLNTMSEMGSGNLKTEMKVIKVGESAVYDKYIEANVGDKLVFTVRLNSDKKFNDATVVVLLSEELNSIFKFMASTSSVNPDISNDNFLIYYFDKIDVGFDVALEFEVKLKKEGSIRVSSSLIAGEDAGYSEIQVVSKKKPSSKPYSLDFFLKITEWLKKLPLQKDTIERPLFTMLKTIINQRFGNLALA